MFIRVSVNFHRSQACLFTDWLASSLAGGRASSLIVMKKTERIPGWLPVAGPVVMMRSPDQPETIERNRYVMAIVDFHGSARRSFVQESIHPSVRLSVGGFIHFSTHRGVDEDR